MKYDFQTLVDRTEQGSKKWLLMREEKTAIADGVAPLSVADLDFPMAPELIEGLKKELDHFIMGYTVPTKRYYQAVQKWMKEWKVRSEGVPAVLLTETLCDYDCPTHEDEDDCVAFGEKIATA